LRQLPNIVAELADEWSISVGELLGDGFWGLVLEATDADGQDVVLKLGVPDGLVGIPPFSQELDTLLLADGPPYVRVFHHDRERRAVLLERLGRPLGRLGLPVEAQLDAIAETLPPGWKRVPEASLTRGDQKAVRLRDSIERRWAAFGDYCSRQTVDLAIAYTHRREELFDPDTAVLIHADAHRDNILETAVDSGSYALIDPAGLISEPGHDLAIPLREWSDELVGSDRPVELLNQWCDALATATGVDRDSIWEWAFIERVSTGFNFASFEMHDWARSMLWVADLISG
jgi:streptomycin 6-kinase